MKLSKTTIFCVFHVIVLVFFSQPKFQNSRVEFQGYGGIVLLWNSIPKVLTHLKLIQKHTSKSMVALFHCKNMPIIFWHILNQPRCKIEQSSKSNRTLP